MKSAEIVELIRQSNPKVLGKLADDKAARIISAALSVVAKQITETPEGAVKIPSLGSFGIKQVEREKDGQKVSARKISFRVAKAKIKAAKAS